MATTYLTKNDAKHCAGLIDVLKEAGQNIDRELYDLADEHRRMKGGKRGPKKGKFFGGKGFTQNSWGSRDNNKP
jgi:hypothetical protein